MGMVGGEVEGMDGGWCLKSWAWLWERFHGVTNSSCQKV